jgi:hypothetical protein
MNKVLHSRKVKWMLFSLDCEEDRQAPQNAVDWAIKRYKERHGRLPNAAQFPDDGTFKGVNWRGLEIGHVDYHRWQFYIGFILRNEEVARELESQS